jgi:FkbM family methyltransferase
MRYPTLAHSLQVIRSLVPTSVQSIVDVGVQRKTEFLMEAFPDILHHLFEPVRAYHNELKHNYTSKGIPHVLYPIALCEFDGFMYLHKQSLDDSGKITHSQLLREKDNTLLGLIDVEEIECRRLDSALSMQPLDDLSYLLKLDVDGLEESIIASGEKTISGASFIIIETSIGKQNLCSRAALLEAHGFRIFDMCDNAYYYDQLALVDLVMVNDRVRQKHIELRPWEQSKGKVVWSKWQHGFRDLEKVPLDVSLK